MTIDTLAAHGLNFAPVAIMPVGKVLVFIVSYNAERHITGLLERIPSELLEDSGVEFLVIDDASSDAGATQATHWADSRALQRITVLRNPVNQGYGGNQKLGYRLAVDSGYDFVVLLHGDGQYAPELLPAFIETWKRTQADVVLGSRLKTRGSARKGGMPLYKLIGNRILTGLQNRLTGLGLSEYHTGYRGYSTEFLSKVPFEINTNDFHFDTEILLQAAHVGAHIEEIPVPTRYGDEICHVNGFRYAYDVAAASFRFKFHQLGMLCDLKYRDLEPQLYRDKTSMRYSSHRMALEMVRRRSPKTLVDIGCGPGFVAKRCQEMGVRVCGLDLREPLPGTMSQFCRVDLSIEEPPVDVFDFDMVLMLDIIEHLQEPERFLLGLRNRSASLRDGREPSLLVLSTPNVAFVSLRLNLLFGRFTYAERGILDITHKRLFTRKTLLQMLRDCGYEIESVQGVPVPFQAVVGGFAGVFLEKVSAVFCWLWPSLFAFQTLVACRPRPGVRHLLRKAETFRQSTAAGKVGSGE